MSFSASSPSLSLCDASSHHSQQGSASSSSPTPKRHVCTVCDSPMATASALRVHMRIHTGERPFKCPDCPKSFTQRGNLNKHSLIHQGELPFPCGHCGRRFRQKSTMTRHAKNGSCQRNCGAAAAAAMAFNRGVQVGQLTPVHIPVGSANVMPMHHQVAQPAQAVANPMQQQFWMPVNAAWNVPQGIMQQMQHIQPAQQEMLLRSLALAQAQARGSW